MFGRSALQTLSPDGQESSGETIKAMLHSEQLAQALAAVSAAQADGDVGWIQIHFTGTGKIITSAISHNMSIRYEFAGEHQGQGIVKVSGRQLAEYVKQLPAEKLSLQIEMPTKLNIKCGRSSARLQLVQDQTQTDVVVPNLGSSALVKGEVLARWVDSFRDFVMVDDTRYYANGAYIWADEAEGQVCMNAVASDAMRLAKSRLTEDVKLETNDGSAVLVPRKALDEIRRVASADPGRIFSLRWHQDGLFFALQSDNYTLVAKCISGKYPPYDAAIPQSISMSVQIDSKALLESLRRALIFADKNRILKLVFDGPVLDVQSFTPGVKEGEEHVDLLSPVDSSFEVNYNGSLLMGVLSQLSGSKMTLRWENVTRPVKITGEGERGLDVFYLLVPTRF